MKNKLILFCCLLAVCASVHAKSAKEPKKNNVIVVGRVTFKKPIDIKAREKAFTEHGNLQVGKVQDFGYWAEFDKKGTGMADLEDYFYAEVKPKKNGTLYLSDFVVLLFGKASWWHQFALPAGVTLTVPDEAIYVYAGTFEYELDYALRVTGFRHLDEFDAAKKAVSRKVGKDVDLYRVAIDFGSGSTADAK